MNFGDALEKAKDGKQVARDGWSGKYIAMLDPGPNAEMTLAYFYVHNENGEQVPWSPSQQELMAENWEVVA